MSKKIAIIGGGAAGFFAAIAVAEKRTDFDVYLFEKSASVLGKVKVSGGGRCNVTNTCSEPKLLVLNYPRGSKALLGPFTQFGPTDTVKWFESRGVKIKAEADGRMFPESNTSETIVECLLQSAINAGVKIKTKCGVETFSSDDDGENGWDLTFSNHDPMHFDKVLLATGSGDQIWQQLKSLGVEIVSPVPSLFTFNIKDKRIADLAGLSVANTAVKVQGTKLSANGPVLITHWGMSGPGILRVSAWGARVLAEKNYQFKLQINFLPDSHEDKVFEELTFEKELSPKKLVGNSNMYQSIPKRFWQRLVEICGLENKIWAEAPKQSLRKLAIELTAGVYEVSGKSTNKEEFVTCGGIELNEIDFKTMQLKKCKNLYAAGELLDVDAITGGFNFQNAWTTGWLAARDISS
jgi:predicted Rossmann fold flavoprotein